MRNARICHYDSVVLNGSDPNNAADGGVAPPAEDILSLPFRLDGDWAAWEMTVASLGPTDTRTLKFCMGSPGNAQARTNKLHRGNAYRVTLRWLGSGSHTDPYWYCWGAQIGGLPTVQTYSNPENANSAVRVTGAALTVAGDGWFADNPDGLLTEHVHSSGDGTGNVAGGLEATLYVPKVDINGDYNRTGSAANDAHEADAVTFDGPKGMVILANTDDDVDDQNKQPDCEDSVINGATDLADIYTLNLAKLGIAAADIPSGLTLELSVENPSGEPVGAPAAKDRIRIFRSMAQDAQGVIGPDTLPDTVIFKKNPGSSDMDIDLLGGAGELEMGVECIEYGREVIVKLVAKLNGQELCSDSIRLLVSPFLALSNIDKTTKVYVAAENDPFEWPVFYNAVSTALNGVVPIESYGAQTFIQDFAEIGYSRSAPGQAVRKLCVMMGLQGEWFEDKLDADNGYFRTDYGNIGGNIETSPPLPNYDYGRLIVGDSLPGNAEAFFKAQKLQTDNGNLIKLPVEWLLVGHVDEVFTIVPVGSGFKVLVADLQLAIDTLRNNLGEETSGGFAPRADILAVYDDPGNALTLALINNKLAAIRSALSSGLGINETEFIRVPIAFSVDGGILDPDAWTYLPNMINMLVAKNASYDKSLAIPEPFFAPFKQDVITRLSAVGFNASDMKWVDTCEMHNTPGPGEAHCSTNPRRVAP